MRSSVRPAIVLAIGLLLSACQGGLQVPMQRDGATVTVTVQDDTGIVAGAEGGTNDEPSPLPPPPAVWNPSGDLTRVTVYWLSTACSDHPALHLSGNALQLSIDLGALSGSCSPDLLPNLVTLRLKDVVDVSSISVTMAQR
jgi:hypothetical protein